MSNDFGSPGGLSDEMQALLRQAQEMQVRLQETQDEVYAHLEEGSSGGGKVQVVVNGRREIVSLLIDPEVVSPENVEFLQEMITAAVNGAVHKAEEYSRTRMEQVTGGISMPGLF